MSCHFLTVCFSTKNLLIITFFLFVCCSSVNCRSLTNGNKNLYLLGGKLHLKLTEKIEDFDISNNLIEEEEKEVKEESVCSKIKYLNASIIRSISKTTEEPVYLHPNTKFQVKFCEHSADEMPIEKSKCKECAVGANCVNTYRWVNALVRHHSSSKIHSNNVGYKPDLVLLPFDCLCVIGWKEKFGVKKEAIIFE
ncbi:unnamed protein product [Meloidogyne enterolobii]|uniref:Uncharacterized protein n=2 Tax=Meloidogyne enterolobii TaxID=390850 RepID=A0ACB0ZUH3_MELEN